MTRIRGRLAVAALAALAVLLPAAQAQDASAAPATAGPGETIRLVFTVPAPGPVDVGVQRSASCAVFGPDGTETATCASAATLVVARVAPGETTYAWDLPAPSVPGNYTVRFTQTDLLGVLAGGASAEARFTVAPAPADPPAQPLQPGATTTSVDRTWVFAFLHPVDPVQPSDEGAAARWMLSLVGGSGSLLLLLLASRQGGSP